MNIIIFTHPAFITSQSMPRFASMLTEGMRGKGHQVEIWSPRPNFYLLPAPGSIKKWLGYIDQYIVFPYQVRKRLKACPSTTLFVFADQALGPWATLVKNRPHVIHCHDFLAQRSALGEITENPTSWTGRLYQNYIRKGYQQGRNFVSVSNKTREDLHRFLKFVPTLSEVVYNVLNPVYKPINKEVAREFLHQETGIELKEGYILHVGGNQWYKNRPGVIEIYNAWREATELHYPLIMIGALPDAKLQQAYLSSPYKKDIYLLSAKDDNFIHHAYAGASVFLFPSLAEGFGWPIAEAQACGCPVITTNEAPMTEVVADSALLIPRRTSINKEKWAKEGAETLDKVLKLDFESRKQLINRGLLNTKKFDRTSALSQIEDIYKRVAENYTN